MELLKRNIHMDRKRSQNEIQFTVEEDRNIPDVKPDAVKIISEAGEVLIDEIRPSSDQVMVRGRLKYEILYATGENSIPQAVTGEIPFEEQLHMEGIVSTDSVNAKASLEDLSIGLINSRKMSIQAIICLKVYVCELYDEETSVGVAADTPIEYTHKKVNMMQTAIWKKDIFRIREELSIPRDSSNLVSIIWQSVQMGILEFKPLDGKIGVQGELHIFVMYETAEEGNEVQVMDTIVPFGGSMDCQGCREDGILNITYEMNHKEVEIHADDDGEERSIGLEVVLDLEIAMYEQEQVELLSDVYGVNKQIEAKERKAHYRTLLVQNSGKNKLTANIKLKDTKDGVLKILHTEGNIICERKEIERNALNLTGTVDVTLFYQTLDTQIPYHTVKESIPFSYIMEAPGITNNDDYVLQMRLEHIEAVLLDQEEVQVNTAIIFELLAFTDKEENVIENLEIGELDPGTINKLPGMAIYVVREGDTLWKIGKKYYVPVAQIKAVNARNNDEVKTGEKILIVKGMEN